jgi:hypothetical protein
VFVLLGNAGHCKDNSRRDTVHPNVWMRRYWTVGPE